MFRLNNAVNKEELIKKFKKYLNTSYVSVKLIVCKMQIKRLENLNTSYVSVKYKAAHGLVKHREFKYIICFG